MRGRRDAGARAGDHQDQGMLEPAPAAGLERARKEEADRGDREGRVGRAGVGRGGRQAPPFPVRGAGALALLQEARAQEHRAQYIFYIRSYAYVRVECIYLSSLACCS